MMSVQALLAQDKTYSTDVLKSQKKITADEWKSMTDMSAARSQQFKDVTAGENTAWAEKGYTVLKMNQTLNLTTEVNALFDYTASAGQNATGVTTVKKRTVFKIGPGNFEIKDGVIKRLK
jgi:L-ribulose-5-phosphate 3-epimerase UlaE